MKINNYRAGDIIYRKGSPCFQKFVIVLEGSIKNEEKILSIKGGLFGDYYIA